MVISGRDCSEILIQLAAVESALRRTGKLILEDHLEHCITDAINDGDQKEALALQIPMGRLGTADEIAQTVLFLAGDGGSYITGQTLHVNGGMYTV